MAATAPTNLGRRLRLAVAGAAVATALTAATAAAAPTPMAAPAAGPTRPDPGPATGAGTPPPGFLLERGRFKPVAVPPGLEDLAPQGIGPFGLNDRGQIVGEYADAGNVPHGFLLDRGRFTRLDVPGAKATNAAKINNRGQIVGLAVNPQDPASPPPTDTAPMGRMA